MSWASLHAVYSTVGNTGTSGPVGLRIGSVRKKIEANEDATITISGVATGTLPESIVTWRSLRAQESGTVCLCNETKQEEIEKSSNKLTVQKAEKGVRWNIIKVFLTLHQIFYLYDIDRPINGYLKATLKLAWEPAHLLIFYGAN
jgi:hypothetical protein